MSIYIFLSFIIMKIIFLFYLIIYIDLFTIYDVYNLTILSELYFYILAIIRVIII